MGLDDAASARAFGRTVPATAENVAPIRKAIVAIAREAGADEQVQTDLALAVGEACANVVCHAYPPGEVGELVVEAEVEDTQIRVRVIDAGQGMVPRPDSPGLGLGLPLIANLADRLEIHDGKEVPGTSLEMFFALQRPGRRERP
jgi:anti-sigma regulatory factor (Ser/Thr protein kinase)